MDDIIRIGQVSSVNGNSVRVTYPDRGGAVSTDLPMISNGIFRIPNVGEYVVTAHLGNAPGSGYCIGALAENGNDTLLSALNSRLEDIERRLTALGG